jgi:uncharacterized protein (DUF4213/DUF364 family)
MLDELIKTISNADKRMRLRRVVMGLGYIAVQLENNNVGLSANIMHEGPSGCTVFNKAGALRGSSVGEILTLGEQKDPLSRAVCLAAINALTNVEGCGLPDDLFNTISINKSDRVVMIGNIEPVANMLANRGCTIRIYDNRYDTNPLPNNQETIFTACSKADIIVITATSIINDTITDILQSTEQAREVIIMGPSTPMAHDAFVSTPITYLAGSQVTDAEKALEIVMEGGGTPALYRFKAMKKVIHDMHRD